MIYKYNKEIIVHIILEIVIFIVLNSLYGVFLATLCVMVTLVLNTLGLNCYKIDITEDKMIVYKIYDGHIILLWDEVESVEITKNIIESRLIGVVKNMTVKYHGQKEFVVNIRPVEREDMITHIERICKARGIPFSN